MENYKKFMCPITFHCNEGRFYAIKIIYLDCLGEVSNDSV